MFTAIFWKKVWAWLKHYWYWPVIIVLFLFSVISGSGARDKFFDLLFKQKESYEKELEIVRKHLYTEELIPELCNQDLQNCLCEYSKYMRVLNGGRTKRNYQGL